MARPKVEALVTQSLLDRLTITEDLPLTRNASIRMFRDGVKRDVEWLLNTRKPGIDGLERLPLAGNSVMNYGVPDLTQFADPAHNPEELARAILSSLRCYEPRIGKPRVSLVQTDNLARSLRFHVEGWLRLDTAEEQIAFDTVLEMTSGEYEVR